MVAKARFEVAFDVGPDDDPAPADWTDLSGRIREASPVETTVGSQNSAARIQLDNRDGQLDPLGSPYNLVPMRHARITVAIGSTVHPVWRGYVDRWPPVWRFADAVVDVELVDARVWLALQDMAVDLPGQYTHERVDALLTLAGWSETLRDIGTGQVLLDPVVGNVANLRQLMEEAAAADDGHLLVSPAGDIVFRGRHSRLDLSSQLAVGGDNVRVASARTAFDGDRLINVGQVELADGTVHEIRDEASVLTYGPRTGSVRDLPLPWYEAAGHADWRVHRFSQPAMSLPAIVLNVVDDAELAGVLALRVGELVTFTHSPPSGPVEIVGHVESIGHRSIEGLWRTTLDLSPYFGAGPWAQWYSDAALAGDGWVSDTATDGAAWAP